VTPDDFEVRPLRTFEELRRCVALQERVWGEGFSERVPTAILNVARRLGGVISGAFDRNGEMAGFVFGLTGIEDGEPVHWSDMLAVRPEHRNAGLGTRLKLHQRRLLLDAGVRRVYWTFDPLVARNAYLNLVRLGAVAREYVVDMYGGATSRLHAGLGTDRFVALWLLDSPRVEERVRGLGERATVRATNAASTAGAAAAALEAGGVGGLPRPGEPRLDLDAPRLTVAVPADIHALKERDPELARSWREATRAVLPHYLDRGWEVRELLRGDEVSHYLLAR
jgi:predicted GNAT superfamily acetyltransferase